LSLIVSGRHVVHDLRSLPIRSRAIDQRLNRLPLPMSEHRFRLPRLINRQLARVMPTTTIMQKWLTKNAAILERHVNVVVVVTERRASVRVTPPATVDITPTHRRVQQISRERGRIHAVEERPHSRSRPRIAACAPQRVHRHRTTTRSASAATSSRSHPETQSRSSVRRLAPAATARASLRNTARADLGVEQLILEPLPALLGSVRASLLHKLAYHAAARHQAHRLAGELRQYAQRV